MGNPFTKIQFQQAKKLNQGIKTSQKHRDHVKIRKNRTTEDACAMFEIQKRINIDQNLVNRKTQEKQFIKPGIIHRALGS